ncbi:hypothetical protein GT019_28345 [Paenibacillus sp. T1]|uniref:HTH lysR-type domain-containing protein n=1 Tax=Paenibacillus glycinis TaxID=2697035 RepID=A0ABW9XYM6_9BACL|nr:hypothetical protein [Paenibacillus glycinis]
MLHIAQQPLSFQIKRLEDELDANQQLFDDFIALCHLAGFSPRIA